MLDAGQAVEYIEVTAEDIAQANALAHEVLGRSLDELPPQTRRLLASIVEHVRGQARAQAIPQAEVRFTRKDVRERTGWGDTQLKVHLARLFELEYLLTHRAERGQGFAYELLFDGDVAAGVHLSGLIDAAGLGERDYDAQRSGPNVERSASGRGAVGLRSGVVQVMSSAAEQALARLATDEPDDEPQTHALRPNGTHPSCVATPSLAAEVHQ
jgi:DNA primase